MMVDLGKSATSWETIKTIQGEGIGRGVGMAVGMEREDVSENNL